MSAAAFFGGSSDPAYWVSGTSYAQGKIIRSPSDHQLYTRIVAGAGTTDPSADASNWRPEGMRAIRSIQRGEITLTTLTTGTATVSSVNTAKSDLTYLGCTANGSAVQTIVRIVLTNSTTITATRANVGAPDTSVVSWQLVEYF